MNELNIIERMLKKYAGFSYVRIIHGNTIIVTRASIKNGELRAMQLPDKPLLVENYEPFPGAMPRPAVENRPLPMTKIIPNCLMRQPDHTIFSIPFSQSLI